MAWLGYRGCRQGASPPSETNCYPAITTPFFSPLPSSLALLRALGMRRSREGWAAEKVQVSSRARASGLGLLE